MPDVTANLLVDLDSDGSFIYDLCAARGDYTSGFWKIEDGFDLSGRGRSKELDEGEMTTMILSLDNATGDFSPKNTTSFYSLFSVNRFRPYIGAHVKFTFNGVTYDQIKGIITDIKIGPEAGDQLCEITIRDYMFVLSRTEIRRPLMLNQYTGVITNRLLDDVEGAEDREACLNPIFMVDLSGWTGLSAILTRITTSDPTTGHIILEGPAGMSVLTSAANGGARYTMSGHSGEKFRLSAYVKPYLDSSIGLTVQMRINDGGGIVALGTAGTLNRDYWTRIEVEGTYSGNATQYLEILAPTSGTSFRVGAAHAVPFVAAINRDVDDGQSRLEKYTYHRGPALTAIQEVRENELGALAYFAGNGTFVFEDRHYRWRETRCLTSQVTLDERGRLDYQESGDDLIKSVVFDYPHYVDGVAGTVVWEADRVQVLPVGFRIPIEADYQGGLVRDTINPVANTDYTIVDGSGVDRTGSVTFEFDDFGGGSVGYFTNNHTTPVTRMTYRVRGTPVRLASDRTPARYTSPDGPPLAATLSHDYQYNASEPHMQAWTNHVGIHYSTQRPRLGLSLSAPFPEASVTTTDMVTILARTVSDRVTVVNNNLPFATDVNDPFHIDSIDLRCTGHSLDANWRLADAWDDFARTNVTVTNGAAKTGP